MAKMTSEIQNASVPNKKSKKSFITIRRSERYEKSTIHSQFKKFVHKFVPSKTSLEELRKQPHNTDMIFKQGVLPSEFTCKYKITSLLGQGTYGFVYQAESLCTEQNIEQNNKNVAVKFILKDRQSNQHVHTTDNGETIPFEIYCVKSLKHKNIIGFVDYFETDDFYILVTEIFGHKWNPNCQARDLFEFINSFSSSSSSSSSSGYSSSSESESTERNENRIPIFAIKKILYQLVSVMCFLKKNNVAHMDIKDENILIDENYNIKLVDFGSAIPADKEKMLYHRQGTALYSPPEMLMDAGGFGAFGVDVWSIGLLLYCMLFNGRNAFQSDSDIMYKNVKNEIENNTQIPSTLRKILVKSLEKNPTKRISIEKMSKMLHQN